MPMRWAHIEVREGVRGFQGWDDALQFGQQLEGIQRLLVCDRKVLCSAEILEVAVLWSDARVVQPVHPINAGHNH